jgi:hypothetical protein
MQDRLRSLKYSRAMRDICFCLGAALLLESAFLLTNYLIWGHRFLLSGVLFLALATMSGYMAYYFHGRFRRRR